MSNTTNVELRFTLVDRGVVRGLDNVEQRVRQTEQRITGAVEQSNTRQRSSHDRLSRAREVIGVRSEHAVRREMQQTEAAYQRLARSGTASQDMLSRAADRTRQRITQLTNEMGRLTAEQQRAARAAADFERAQGRIRTGVAVGAVGAGVVAAGYALKAPVSAALSFDERLASMSNTAFPDRNASGRLAGANDLESVINQSVDLKRGGGGTRDQAADALDALLAKGTIPMEQALKFLPTVMRTAYGSSAQPLDIANLASSLVGQGVVGNQGDLKRALNMATASGQAGGFEIKDMAKWLPGQLAVGKTAGLVGLPGLQKILTMNQASILTSGGTDQAGNNVQNLLSKLASQDTAKDFKKQGNGDLTNFLMDQRIKGVDSVDAWLNLIDKLASKNPQLDKALKQLDVAGNKQDQQSAINSISQMSEGSIIGQYFQDMQARGALFGMRNKAVTGRVGAAISNNSGEYGANDVNFQTMAGTGAAAVRNAEQEAAIKQKAAMDMLIPTITKAADMFTDLSQKYPDLSAAVVGATPPVVAFGAAAGLSAVALGGAGGGLAAAAMGTASALSSAMGAIAAAAAGYQLGKHVIAPAVDKAVQYFSGDKNQTLGGAIYDGVQGAKNMVHVVIEPKSMGYLARVDKSKSRGVATTETKGGTGNAITGAP